MKLSTLRVLFIELEYFRSGKFLSLIMDCCIASLVLHLATL